MSGLPPHNPDIKMIITRGKIWFLKLTNNGKFLPERIFDYDGVVASFMDYWRTDLSIETGFGC